MSLVARNVISWFLSRSKQVNMLIIFLNRWFWNLIEVEEDEESSREEDVALVRA